MKPTTTTSNAENAGIVVATPSDELAAADAIRLDSCGELEWIVVKTRNSTYQLIVLSGDTGEVMVRGGEFFNEFRPATIAGSILGGADVKLRTICAGSHLELQVDGKSFVTSRVERVSRSRNPVAEGAA